MVATVDTATVRIWGIDVGAVTWLAEREYAVFEYYPDFLRQGLDISPIQMSLNAAINGSSIFQFPACPACLLILCLINLVMRSLMSG